MLRIFLAALCGLCISRAVAQGPFPTTATTTTSSSSGTSTSDEGTIKLSTTSTTAPASITPTATFFPIVDYTEFSSLQICQQQCVTGAPAGVDSASAVSLQCGALVPQVKSASMCVMSASAPCAGNTQSAYGAQVVLEDYCSEMAEILNMTVSPVSVANPTDSEFIPNPSSTVFPGSESTSGVTSSATSVSTGGIGSTTPSSSPAPGMSNNEKIGLGVGLGLGVPLLIGIAAAAFSLTRRRRSRGTQGPYGAVLASDKGVSEDDGPHMDKEMQPMSSTAPFLPVPAAAGMQHYEPQHQPQYEAIRGVDDGFEPAPSAPVERPQTALETPVSAMPRTEDMSRPATAPQHLSPPDDEPPSPISPMSPISPAGSRPVSLRSYERHEH